jgi:hypothetical protein
VLRALRNIRAGLGIPSHALEARISRPNPRLWHESKQAGPFKNQPLLQR